MRRLGRELGVEAMSIYHHVPSKAALLDLVVADVLAEASSPAATESIVDALAHFARTLRRTVLANPDLTTLVIGDRRLLHSDATRSLATRLRAVGFDGAASAWIVESFVGFAVGQSALAVRMATRADTGDQDAAFETGLRFLLAGLRDELEDDA